MATEVYLERVPGEDVSVARCSICKEEFHSSPVGPRKHMRNFHAHTAEKHPDAIFKPDPKWLFPKRHDP